MKSTFSLLNFNKDKRMTSSANSKPQNINFSNMQIYDIEKEVDSDIYEMGSDDFSVYDYFQDKSSFIDYQKTSYPQRDIDILLKPNSNNSSITNSPYTKIVEKKSNQDLRQICFKNDKINLQKSNKPSEFANTTNQSQNYKNINRNNTDQFQIQNTKRDNLIHQMQKVVPSTKKSSLIEIQEKSSEFNNNANQSQNFKNNTGQFQIPNTKMNNLICQMQKFVPNTKQLSLIQINQETEKVTPRIDTIKQNQRDNVDAYLQTNYYRQQQIENQSNRSDSSIFKSSSCFPIIKTDNQTISQDTSIFRSNSNFPIINTENQTIPPSTSIFKSNSSFPIIQTENQTISQDTPVFRSNSSFPIVQTENQTISQDTPVFRSNSSFPIVQTENQSISQDTSIFRSNSNFPIINTENQTIPPSTSIFKSNSSFPIIQTENQTISQDTPIFRSNSNFPITQTENQTISQGTSIFRSDSNFPIINTENQSISQDTSIFKSNSSFPIIQTENQSNSQDTPVFRSNSNFPIIQTENQSIPPSTTNFPIINTENLNPNDKFYQPKQEVKYYENDKNIDYSDFIEVSPKRCEYNFDSNNPNFPIQQAFSDSFLTQVKAENMIQSKIKDQVLSKVVYEPKLFIEAMSSDQLFLNPCLLKFEPKEFWISYNMDLRFKDIVNMFFRLNNTHISKFIYKLYNMLQITSQIPLFKAIVGVNWITNRIFSVNVQYFSAMINLSKSSANAIISGKRDNLFSIYNFVEITPDNYMTIGLSEYPELDSSDIKLMFHRFDKFVNKELSIFELDEIENESKAKNTFCPNKQIISYHSYPAFS